MRNAYDRAAQVHAAADPLKCLAFAKSVVPDKAMNQRTQLRRNAPPSIELDRTLGDIDALVAKVGTAASVETLLGFYHRPRHGRPALALDLMEPFRPVVADSAVMTAINTGMVRSAHFTRAASGCAMNDAGRKGLPRAYEGRLDQLVTHPVFDYRCSWRSVIRLQARLLFRWLRGDVPEFNSVVTR